MTRSVAVVGAGAVGATAAFDLALRDADVTLYERDGVASGSTGRAAGICYDAFAEDVDAEIAGDAIERFRTFDGHGEFEFHERPYVWLAREGDERRAEAIREGVPRMQDNDRTVLLLEPDLLANRFPTVAHDDVAIAAVAGAAGYTDPGDYARLLAVMAKRKGAELRTDAAVSVSTDPPRVDGEAYDAVLVAAGAHTASVLADAGLSVAVKPYRVQALTTDAAYDGPMVYDATEGFYLRPHADGLLAGDGTETVAADPDDYDHAADADFEATLPDSVADRVDVAGAVVDSWAGLCTATPDRDPLVGELAAGIYVATGFQGHGFMRAPAFGERLALELLDEDEDVDRTWVEAFDPTRFDGDEAFDIVEGMLPEERVD
jgi:glycine/D-amino acid oxidase-like deaminating enzyme